MRIFDDIKSPYVEALPRLDVLQAEKMVRAGRPCPHWFSETGALLGSGTIREFASNRLALDYGFLSEGLVETAIGSKRFRIERRETLQGYLRPSVICERCVKNKSSLILHQRQWYCHVCHGLHYRRQRIDTLTSRNMRLIDLNNELLYGRPKGMHNRTYQARLRERAVLGDYIAGRPATLPSAALRFELHLRWEATENKPINLGVPSYGEAPPPQRPLPKRMIVPLISR